MMPIVSYMPAILWRETAKGGHRGAIRDSYPAEGFRIDEVGAALVLSIGRISTPWECTALDLDCRDVESAKAAAQRHVDAGPINCGAGLSVSPILRNRIQYIRDQCVATVAVTALTGPAPLHHLARDIVNVLNGEMDDVIRTEDGL